MTAWLNAHQGLLTLGFSFVVTIATVFYVLLTRELVKETRLVRAAQIQPNVSIRVQINAVAFGFTDLVVENIGAGPAYDIRFSFPVDFELERDRKRSLSSVGFLRSGFRYLPPGQPISTFLMPLLGLSDEVLTGPTKLGFDITVQYKDAVGQSFEETFSIDFAHFAGLIRLGSPPLPEIAKSLAKLSDDITKLSSGWHKIKVVQYTPEDLDRERDAFRLAQMSGQLIAEASEPAPKGPADAA